MYSCAFSNIKDSVKTYKNSAFVEFGGNGYSYSVNYERFLYTKSKWAISAKIGLSYYYNFHNATYLPISAEIYYGSKSKIELGFGYTPIFRWSKISEEGTIFSYDKTKYTENGKKNFIKGHDEPYASLVFINIGWHQEIEKKCFFKIEASPWLAKSKSGYVLIPWGKLSFGKNF